MSQYRDDLEAAHERINALEREVADLRHSDDQEEPAAPAGAEERSAPDRGGAVLVAFGMCFLVGLLLVALVTRRPSVFVLVPPFFCLFVLAVMMGRLVHLARPNELLVLSGMKRRLPDGGVASFRVVSGGRVVAMPFLERAQRMDLRPRCPQWTVDGAYTRDGVLVTASGFLLFAVDPERPGAAIERFLGRTGEEMEEVARETLEGCLRAALATVTLDDIGEDPTSFQRACTAELEPELRKLGLRLLDHHLLRIRETDQDAVDSPGGDS